MLSHSTNTFRWIGCSFYRIILNVMCIIKVGVGVEKMLDLHRFASALTTPTTTATKKWSEICLNYRQIQSKSCEHKVALFCEAYSQSMKESNFLFNILNSLKTELRRETGIKSAVSVCVWMWMCLHCMDVRGSKIQMKIPDNPGIVGVVSLKWRVAKDKG